ncbi:hypothetical protein ACWCYZ_45575 [Streptomyces virginiae]
MTERVKKNGARWGARVWVVGVAGVLAALPFAASGRLPDRLATHWGGSAPNGSMPLWAAALLPALAWAALALCVAFIGRRGGFPAGPWVGASLLSGGVLLAGAQASIVRANLDVAGLAGRRPRRYGDRDHGRRRGGGGRARPAGRSSRSAAHHAGPARRRRRRHGDPGR